MDNRLFGDLLRSFRVRAQLTQKELAALAEVSQRDISDLERGVRRYPYRYTVDQLAEALQLSEAEHALLAAAARRTALPANSPNPPDSLTTPVSPQPDAEQHSGDAPGDAHASQEQETVTNAAPVEPAGAVVPHMPQVPQPLPVSTPPARGTLVALDVPKKLTRPRHPLLSRTIPVVLVAMLLAGGVLRYDAALRRQAAPPQTPAAPESQQVVRVGANFLDILDPQLVTTASPVEMAELIFPKLVQLDENLNVERWGASQIQISPDGRIYTFTLRHGMTWSNGVPITASDFAFAINRALDACTQAYGDASNLYQIAEARAFYDEPCVNGAPSGAISTLIGRSLQVIDPETLIIHLHDPAAYFLEALTISTSWAVPEWLVSQYGDQWTQHLADGEGLGGDLFKVVSWQVGKRLVLRRNEHFWGTHARLREIDFTTPPKASTTYAAYLNGELDMSGVPNEAIASARLRPDFHQRATLTTVSLSLNWSEPPFNDERIRQAFALALNKVQLVRDSFSATGSPTNHLVPQGEPGYFADLTGPDGTTGLTGNVTRASFLAQGYASDSCGGDLRRCPPVVVALPSNLPSVGKAMSAFGAEAQHMWQQAMPGYPITVRLMPFEELVPQADAGKFQIFPFIWGADYPDPQDWLSLLLLPDSPFNTGHVDVGEANTLMRQADVDQNATRRLSEYNQAEQLLVTEVARIPLYQEKIPYVAQPYVVNYATTAAVIATSDIWQRIYIARH